MGTVGINFGSATSGTGFNVSTTVSSIMAQERLPETAWSAQSAALQKQDSVLSTLGTDLSALSSAVSSLTQLDGVFAQKAGSVSDTGVAALVSAGQTASAGIHVLTVQQLAMASTQHSNAVAANVVLNGDFTLQVGSGSVQSITLSSSNNTIAGLAAAINSLNAGVAATVITDSAGSRLSLVSAQSGAAGEITTGGSVTDSSGNPLVTSESQAGTDAAYTLDGIALSNSSNTITTALPGVTFQLLSTTSNPVQMQIANDTSGISSALGSFVSAYNMLSTALAGQEKNDASGVAEPLFGDSIVSQMQQQLSSALSFVTGNTGTSSNLSQLGISVQANGQLSLDTNALSSALQSNFGGAVSFFQGVGDFGQNLTATLNNLVTTGNGALALRNNQNASQEKTLADNTSHLEERLTNYQAQLTQELNTANQVLQGIPQQLNEVNQIYAAITGYTSTQG